MKKWREPASQGTAEENRMCGGNFLRKEPQNIMNEEGGGVCHSAGNPEDNKWREPASQGTARENEYVAGIAFGGNRRKQ